MSSEAHHKAGRGVLEAWGAPERRFPRQLVNFVHGKGDKIAFLKQFIVTEGH